MQDFQHRKKVRRKLYSRNAVIVLGLVTLLIVRGAYGVLKKEHQSALALTDAELQLKTAQANQATLASNVALLHTDAGVEQEIREKYSVVKAGESVAIIVDNDEATTTPIIHKTIWQKIGDWFKNIF